MLQTRRIRPPTGGPVLPSFPGATNIVQVVGSQNVRALDLPKVYACEESGTTPLVDRVRRARRDPSAGCPQPAVGPRVVEDQYD